MNQLQDIVAILRAAGEVTRLRIVALLLEGELSVKDLTEILGQSQPRVSRHLKLLVDARMVTRHPEGAWAYFRLNRAGAGGALSDWVARQLDTDTSEIAADRQKLDALRVQQRERAAKFFATIADDWDRLRSLHVAESAVEQAIRDAADGRPVRQFLDLGTGTGRMLEVLSDRYRDGIGLDSSREMLSVARANLDAAGVENAQVRLADILALEDYFGSADLITLHQVLHYFDDPGVALSHAARCLTHSGRIFVVDFAPHDHEFLRSEQAHRRLGMSEAQLQVWAEAAGLTVDTVKTFPPVAADGLTVCLWVLVANFQ